MKYPTYKNYQTIMKWDEEDKIYYGKIEGIHDLVSFHSKTKEDFEKEFHNAVEDYFAFCKEIGKEPEIPTNTHAERENEKTNEE